MNHHLKPVALLAVLLFRPPVLAADPPKYPRVNLAAAYRVDPSWPQKPEKFVWGHMPGVAVDEFDNVWTFTRATPPIQVYASEGTFVKSWGEDILKKAHHLKIDHEGNVWVADIELHCVMQFSPDGKLLREIGLRGEKGDDERRLNMPTDMVMTKEGDVFISDGYGNNRVVHFDKDNKFVKAWGKLGTEPGDFSLPHAIDMDSKGRLYVADRNNIRVQVFDQSGELLDVWSNVITPWGFCVTKDDHIWVCGSSPMTWEETPEENPLGCPPKDQIFARFNTAGKLLELATIPKGLDGKEQPGDLNWVHALAVDSKGNIYAGDIIGQRVQKFVRFAPAKAEVVERKGTKETKEE